MAACRKKKLEKKKLLFLYHIMIIILQFLTAYWLKIIVGFVCVRGFDRTTRAPRPLIARLHFSASKLGNTKNYEGRRQNRPWDRRLPADEKQKIIDSRRRRSLTNICVVHSIILPLTWDAFISHKGSRKQCRKVVGVTVQKYNYCFFFFFILKSKLKTE